MKTKTLSVPTIRQCCGLDGMLKYFSALKHIVTFISEKLNIETHTVPIINISPPAHRGLYRH